jgi:soluble lytic murein transglycosylase-like protein
MILLLFAGAASFVLHDQPSRGVMTAESDSASASASAFLHAEVRGVFASFEVYTEKLQRAQEIANYGRHYGITSRLANDIFSAAENAGVDPDLAFRLVRLESFFDEKATSPVGAIGLTQVMLPTALFYDETMTAERLYDRKVNLRIGLSYLREMLDQHSGDIVLALASYNRGPGAVERMLAQGRTPNNAYERIILKGYTGRGILE